MDQQRTKMSLVGYRILYVASNLHFGVKLEVRFVSFYNRSITIKKGVIDLVGMDRIVI
mgnify:FL=1|jgi:hypothetical protein